MFHYKAEIIKMKKERKLSTKSVLEPTHSVFLINSWYKNAVIQTNLKYLRKQMADLKPFVFEQLFFIIKQSLNLNGEYLPNIEFSDDQNHSLSK